MKRWQCSVCKYIHKGDEPPEKCPVCGVDKSKFVLLEDEEPASKPPSAPTEATRVKPDAPNSEDKSATRSAPQNTPAPAATFYDKGTALMVKHHAHPVTVHMPNGVIPVAAALFILSWIFGSGLFASAGFINLVFVAIALPLVLFSGVLEWKQKYSQAATLIFKIKILSAAVTTTACLASIIWYLLDPGVLASPKAWVFILLNLVMLGAAGVAGHIGGKLVFKD